MVPHKLHVVPILRGISSVVLRSMISVASRDDAHSLTTHPNCAVLDWVADLECAAQRSRFLPNHDILRLQK